MYYFAWYDNIHFSKVNILKNAIRKRAFRAYVKVCRKV